MANFKLTRKAVEDLSEIWNYTFDNWSEHQADKYYRLLLENCHNIAENPYLGKDYSGIVKGIMGFRAGRHIIFYKKIENEEIQILRFLHEQMDLKNRMTKK
jgi:toxin ParE1/3/4